MNKITIATRGSKLAMWQAEHIGNLLTKHYPNLEVEFQKIKTSGDKIQDVPLAKVGGKGLFVKEIEEALLDGSADIAVHSMKDVPAELPDGLKLGVMPPRESRFDLLLSPFYPDLDSLPESSRIGTSSLRRQAQLMHLRPDLRIEMLRGNLDTRLKKMEQGLYDAIIVAAAGMYRLGLQATHATELVPPDFLPAVGQGALGIEYRKDRDDLEDFLAFMDDYNTRVCVSCERSFLAELEGGCQVPIACYCSLKNSELQVTGLVCDLKGDRLVNKSRSGNPDYARDLGAQLAREVLAAGGREILDEIYSSQDSLLE